MYVDPEIGFYWTVLVAIVVKLHATPLLSQHIALPMFGIKIYNYPKCHYILMIAGRRHIQVNVSIRYGSLGQDEDKMVYNALVGGQLREDSIHRSQ